MSYLRETKRVITLVMGGVYVRDRAGAWAKVSEVVGKS